MMNALTDFKPLHKPQFILTDIDDTITTEGQLHANAYNALWQLHQSGYKVIPVTGRPAGWCEMIARFWPVAGIIGENGGFYFRYENLKMKRWFFNSDAQMQANKAKLNLIQSEVLKQVPKAAVSSDQFCRLMDLAIDFCEDIPKLPDSDIQKIVDIFHAHGAVAKVSSIHVNGWFGNYDKVSTALHFLKTEFGLTEQQALQQTVFCGDSPNDEPMFEKFPVTFGVANIKNFQSKMKYLPTYIATRNGGDGFCEIAEALVGLS